VPPPLSFLTHHIRDKKMGVKMSQIDNHLMEGVEGMKRRGKDVRYRQRAKGVEGMTEVRSNG
jgi:hypothetical protein